MKGYKVPEHMIDGLKNWIGRFPSDDKYAWGMNAVVEDIESLPLEELDDNWHTGTPTEGGWYLLKVRHEGDIVYYANRWAKIIDYQWVYAMYGEVVGWQRIEE